VNLMSELSTDTKSKGVDYTRAVKFLTGWPTSNVHLVAIHPDRPEDIKGRSFEKNEGARAAKWMAKAQAAGYGLYFSVNDLVRDLGPGYNKASDREVTLMVAVHADLDLPKHEMTPDQRKAEKRGLYDRAKAHALSPTVLINSGNGIQAYSVLSEPVVVTDANRLDLKARNKQFASELGADKCFDLSHVMRVPFTINFPNAGKRKLGWIPVATSVIFDHADLGLTYHIDEFKPAALDAAAAQSTGSAYADIGAPEIPVSIDLSALTDTLRQRIEQGASPGSDRSKVVYSVVCDLIRAGWDYGAILHVATNPDYPISEHIYDQPQREPHEQASRFIRDAVNKGVTRNKTAEEDFSPEDELYTEDAKSLELRERERANAEALNAIHERPEDQREPRLTLPQIAEAYVWVSTLKRFFLRSDPTIVHDKESFNDKFEYVRGPRNPRVADMLFSRHDNTIRKVDRIVYEPGSPEFVGGKWNLWRPTDIKANAGDTTLWNDHLKFLFPDDRERALLLNWLAGVLQQPNVKPMHALLLIGRLPGTGKTFIADVLGKLVGEVNRQVLTQDVLATTFTGWATRTKLVVVEELRAVDKREVTKKLHPWITSPKIIVNEKNIPTFMLDQVVAFFLMSNKPDPIQPDMHDRRYLTLETKARPHPGGIAYYSRLYALLKDPEALGAILVELLERKLPDSYSIVGPAPDTEAKRAMTAASAEGVAQWMLEHQDEPPCSYRVVTVNEIFQWLPRHLQTARTLANVKEALTEFFNAEPWPEQIRPRGRQGEKLRVWVMHADKQADLKSADVLRMYREDRSRNEKMDDGDDFERA
jgi:hypothetical protein